MISNQKGVNQKCVHITTLLSKCGNSWMSPIDTTYASHTSTLRAHTHKRVIHCLGRTHSSTQTLSPMPLGTMPSGSGPAQARPSPPFVHTMNEAPLPFLAHPMKWFGLPTVFGRPQVVWCPTGLFFLCKSCLRSESQPKAVTTTQV